MTAMKALWLAALFLFFSPACAAAGGIQIIDGQRSGGSGFVMWSSIDTNTDARTVESGFTMVYGDPAALRAGGLRYRVARAALRFLGTPFVWGGATSAGFDCSGFVEHVFAQLGIVVPRTADYQYAALRHIHGGLRPGDLVFFQTYAPGASHVGIYLGNGEFIHSSRPFVHISRLSDPYFAARYIGAASAF
jgi:hypothetical protein